MKRTLHLVWNESRTECVGFLDQSDADWTATGNRKFLVGLGSPSIGEDFRTNYATGRKVLPQTSMEIDL